MLIESLFAVREGIRIYLDTRTGIDLVADVKSGSEAIEVCEVIKPDVVLMELVLPDGSGLDIMHALQDVHPEVEIIFLTNAKGSHLLDAAKNAGAAGLITKGVRGEVLCGAIQNAMNGGKHKP
jgi:DNA-binding NarL/FixJ family response regulator